ncbi:unnamed protein product [Spirodela intermedia]|uniref:Large ribosomal subunit protein uL29m n=1 Tax=Spirodela intermedia TaxID=51605 RepID=A0A7I8IZX9_SPIIN|nr:unnamed protein product [Spirodela intermedia]CAA6663437.1 unnamed protein product [Spirodela intermedia]
MLLYRLLGRRFLAAAAKSESSAGSAAAATATPRVAATLWKSSLSWTEIRRRDACGRSWKASELRLKSWDDLQKLWYVLLKEKNMLMSQRQMLNAQNLRFPNPERIPKVRKSMCRIKHVLTERAIAEPDPRRSAEMKRWSIPSRTHPPQVLLLHPLDAVPLVLKDDVNVLLRISYFSLKTIRGSV